MADKQPKAKELRTMPAADLNAQIQSLRQELWSHRTKARDGALQQTHVLRVLRRQEARIQTILREQQRQQP